jgi:purine-binding chemotaxis protein CheW
VVDIPSASIGPAPEGALGDRAEFISGVARQDERLIILIDVSRILSSAERRELSEAGSVNT